MDNGDDHGPDYAAVISVARSILNDVLNQLDRVGMRYPACLATPCRDEQALI
jgi:hypothetical protein